jgi:hypothetical protein
VADELRERLAHGGEVPAFLEGFLDRHRPLAIQLALL